MRNTTSASKAVSLAAVAIVTDDIDEAAFLLSEGARLVAVERAPNGYSSFAIEGDDAQALADHYARGGVLVDLDRFLAARRLILDRIARARKLGRSANEATS